MTANILQKKSGAVYINYMMELGKQMPINRIKITNSDKNKEDVRTQEMELEMETDKTNSPKTKQGQGKDMLVEMFHKLEEKVNEHSKNLQSSNIAIRKIREELDAETNERKMDMLVISGVRPSSRWPHKDMIRDKNE